MLWTRWDEKKIIHAYLSYDKNFLVKRSTAKKISEAKPHFHPSICTKKFGTWCESKYRDWCSLLIRSYVCSPIQIIFFIHPINSTDLGHFNPLSADQNVKLVYFSKSKFFPRKQLTNLCLMYQSVTYLCPLFKCTQRTWNLSIFYT
jgi:hypothetical protein